MTQPGHPLMQQLESVAAMAEAEFARGAALHGDRIQCRRGCNDCCGQVFRITEPEAARISQFVNKLDGPQRARLQLAARDYARRRSELFGGAETWESPVPQGAKLPCPALGPQGECSIYEARPIICRKFGVPLFNPQRPDNVMACELNFKPGEPIEDDLLVQQQTSLFRAQNALQAAWNDAGGARSDAPLCVASALVQDLSGLLP